LFEVKRSAAYGWAKRTTTRFRAWQAGRIRDERLREKPALAHRRVRVRRDGSPLAYASNGKWLEVVGVFPRISACNALPRRWTAAIIPTAIRFPAVPSGTSPKGASG